MWGKARESIYIVYIKLLLQVLVWTLDTAYCFFFINNTYQAVIGAFNLVRGYEFENMTAVFSLDQLYFLLLVALYPLTGIFLFIFFSTHTNTFVHSKYILKAV